MNLRSYYLGVFVGISGSLAGVAIGMWLFGW